MERKWQGATGGSTEYCDRNIFIWPKLRNMWQTKQILISYDSFREHQDRRHLASNDSIQKLVEIEQK